MRGSQFNKTSTNDLLDVIGSEQVLEWVRDNVQTEDVVRVIPVDEMLDAIGLSEVVAHFPPDDIKEELGIEETE